MERYIDSEKIKYHKLSVCEGHGMNFEYTVAYKHEVDAIPTADVVPKSEVETLAKEVDRLSQCVLYNDGVTEMLVEEAKQEVEREIFAEIEEYAELQIESLNIAEKIDSSGTDFFGGGKQAFVLLLDRLAELKKKYKKGAENDR